MSCVLFTLLRYPNIMHSPVFEEFFQTQSTDEIKLLLLHLKLYKIFPQSQSE